MFYKCRTLFIWWLALVCTFDQDLTLTYASAEDSAVQIKQQINSSHERYTLCLKLQVESMSAEKYKCGHCLRKADSVLPISVQKITYDFVESDAMQSRNYLQDQIVSYPRSGKNLQQHCNKLKPCSMDSVVCNQAGWSSGNTLNQYSSSTHLKSSLCYRY